MGPSELVYIGLGTNLGDRHRALGDALAFLHEHRDIDLLRVSRLYETPPMGPPQPDYLNAAAECRTSLSPGELLAALKGHEASAGRVERVRWGPRPIDLDILIFGERRVEGPGLTIPHKGLASRCFVLGPLEDLIPEVTPPSLTSPVKALMGRLMEQGEEIHVLPWPPGLLPPLPGSV